MSPIESITAWFSNYKQYLFSYKQGFFELPYLANSPDTLVGSMKKMPFNKYHKDKNLIVTNNPFCSGELYFEELEDGIWIVATSMAYKKNVAFNLIYNNLPAEYYTLTFHINESPILVDDPMLNGLVYRNYSWSFMKPKGGKSSHYFKNSSGKYFNIFLRKDWVETHLRQTSQSAQSDFLSFIASGHEHFATDRIPDRSLEIVRDVYRIFEETDRSTSNPVLMLKSRVYEMISLLSQHQTVQMSEPESYVLKKSDMLIVAQTEHELLKHLLGTFPGTELLAEQFNVSPTKLKKLFKRHHGIPLFQFYQEKKMNLASELLTAGDLSIKEVAHRVGYETAGKFTVAFKAKHGVTPSEYQFGRSR